MELKKYQRAALEDLGRYLKSLASSEKLTEAWQKYWNYDAPKKYCDKIGVPAVCMKVPTGGGKTFMACAALAEIFGRLPREMKLVVWLVPSESILTQTLAALSDSAHPYRARLNEDFGGRVEVCPKEMLLQGQNFNPATVQENLTVCVISYASIRIDSRKKDSRKFYQENGALINFGMEPTLIKVLQTLRPVVVVDESHNAGSELSVEMLQNLNPSFVLELTATPKVDSNIICEVRAAALKAEQMIKLPVIIFPPKFKGNFLASVVEFRESLEREAEVEDRMYGRYIRPIVLFQAQADTKDDSETFKTIRKELIKAGIPAEEIAIKTANVNELKNENLLSRECKIRYIITINALKEGWDCPFAYILASLANRNSKTDVAQIVGRILRQPYAVNNSSRRLNACYVFSQSSNFNHTVKSVAAGLNGEGLDENDAVPVDENDSGGGISVQDLDAQTERAIDDFDGKSGGGTTISVKPEFSGGVKDLKIPQFFHKIRRVQIDAFDNSEYVDELLSAENLSDGFSLARADTEIHFELDIRKVDLNADGRYEAGGVSMNAAAEYQKFIDSKTPEERAEYYAGQILNILSRYHSMKTVSTADLRNYIRRVIGGMSDIERADLKIDTAVLYAEQIKDKVHRFETLHRKKIFGERIGANKIFCKSNYVLKDLTVARSSSVEIEKSLYAVEGDMNEFEARLIRRIAVQENVTWWHRNIERQGFCLNGWLNHYPDFIVRTDSGRIILVEAKGDYLANDDTEEKISLGRDWQNRAGDNYRYFMVFDNRDVDGAYNFSKFVGVIRSL